MPLFWNETKTAGLFEAILQNYGVFQVVDMSAGVNLALASLRLSLKYAGLGMSPDHSNWLQNNIDRAAIQLIVDAKHSLYQQSLATLLTKFFPEQANPKEEEDQADTNPATPE